MSVLIFIIPLLIGLIAYFAKLKNESGRTVWDKPTFAGYIVILLTVAYFLLGILDLVTKERKEDQKENRERQANETIDSLEKSMNYIKGRNDSYIALLYTLGYKIDTTKKDAKRNIDSLKMVILNQARQLDTVKANIDLCVSDSNLVLKQIDGRDYKLPIYLCNYKPNQIVHGIFIRYSIIQASKNLFVPIKNEILVNTPSDLQSTVAFSTDIYFGNYNVKDTLYLFLKGRYYDENNRKYSFEHLLKSSPHEMKFGIFNEDKLEHVRAFIKLNNL